MGKSPNRDLLTSKQVPCTKQRQIDGIDGQVDRWIDEQLDRWMNRQIDRWMDGWLDEQIDGWMNRLMVG